LILHQSSQSGNILRKDLGILQSSTLYCLPRSIILDLEDDISELSSLSSYPRSLGASSQILLDDRSDISHVNLDDEDDEVNSFLSSRSPSPVPTQLRLQK